MLLEPEPPNKFWVKAVITTIDLQNSLPTKGDKRYLDCGMDENQAENIENLCMEPNPTGPNPKIGFGCFAVLKYWFRSGHVLPEE